MIPLFGYQVNMTDRGLWVPLERIKRSLSPISPELRRALAWEDDVED